MKNCLLILFLLCGVSVAQQPRALGPVTVTTINGGVLGTAAFTNSTAYQPSDSDLTIWAGLTPSANAQSLVTAANYSAMRTLLGLVIGTNVQAYDADLTTWAGITPSANVQTLLQAVDYAAFKASLSLNNVDNTSDSTKNAASVTLTNKTISGASNTLTIRLANDVSGTLPLANGGTGQTSASNAINALVPTQTSNSGKYLTTDGSAVSWGTVAGGGIGGTTGSTDNAVIVANGTGGSTVKASGVTIGTNNAVVISTPNGIAGNPLTVVAGLYSRPVFTAGEDGILIIYGGLNMNGSSFSMNSSLGTGLSSTSLHFYGNTLIDAAATGQITIASSGGLQMPQTTIGIPAANSVIFGGEDVGGTAEAFAVDEAGNKVQLTAHPTDAPPELYDETPGFEEFSKTANYYLGLITWVNRDRIAKLAGMTDTEKADVPKDKRRTAPLRESFEDYNKRTDSKLTVIDWEENQKVQVSKRLEEQSAFDIRAQKAKKDAEELVRLGKANVGSVPKFTDVRPVDVVAKPKPAFLK